jgi:hypothetical protein
MCLIILSAPAFAAAPIITSKGQIVWAPAAYYDRSYMKDAEQVTIFQDSSVTIVNLDLERTIILQSVQLLDNDQNIIKEYVADPIVLGPLKGGRFIANAFTLGIPHFTGAPALPFAEENLCFLVKWKAKNEVTTPAIGSAFAFILVDAPGGHRQLSVVPFGSKVIKERKSWSLFPDGW